MSWLELRYEFLTERARGNKNWLREQILGGGFSLEQTNAFLKKPANFASSYLGVIEAAISRFPDNLMQVLRSVRPEFLSIGDYHRLSVYVAGKTQERAALDFLRYLAGAHLSEDEMKILGHKAFLCEHEAADLEMQKKRYDFLAKDIFTKQEDKILYLNKIKNRFSEEGYKAFISYVLSKEPLLEAALNQGRAGNDENQAELNTTEVEQLVSRELFELSNSLEGSLTDEEIANIEKAMETLSGEQLSENINRFFESPQSRLLGDMFDQSNQHGDVEN